MAFSWLLITIIIVIIVVVILLSFTDLFAEAAGPAISGVDSKLKDVVAGLLPQA